MCDCFGVTAILEYIKSAVKYIVMNAYCMQLKACQKKDVNDEHFIDE